MNSESSRTLPESTASPPREIVVFWIIKDSECAECGEELGKDRFLRMERDRPLCLKCADLDHLVFLERGDAAQLFPGCPADEQRSIAEHACRKYSGRVGRSAEAKQMEPDAITLALRAHVRHAHTQYDELLSRGVPRDEARSLVSELVANHLDTWQRRREPH